MIRHQSRFVTVQTNLDDAKPGMPAGDGQCMRQALGLDGDAQVEHLERADCSSTHSVAEPAWVMASGAS